MTHKPTTPARSAIIAESDRLRQPFLRFVGNRYNADVFDGLRIPRRTGSVWLSGRTLPAEYQQRVRAALGDAGGAP